MNGTRRTVLAATTAVLSGCFDTTDNTMMNEQITQTISDAGIHVEDVIEIDDKVGGYNLVFRPAAETDAGYIAELVSIAQAYAELVKDNDTVSLEVFQLTEEGEGRILSLSPSWAERYNSGEWTLAEYVDQLTKFSPVS